MGDAFLNYFDALFRRAVCVSVHCSHWEQCIQRSFPPDLKPARQLSTCNQWAGIPYRWHFRITGYDIFEQLLTLPRLTAVGYDTFEQLVTLAGYDIFEQLVTLAWLTGDANFEHLTTVAGSIGCNIWRYWATGGALVVSSYTPMAVVIDNHLQEIHLFHHMFQTVTEHHMVIASPLRRSVVSSLIKKMNPQHLTSVSGSL